MNSKMQQNRQLEDPNNVGSEQTNSSADGLMRIFEGQLELMVIRTFERVIEPTMETLIRRVVKEEIDSEMEKLTSMNQFRNSENEISSLESRSLKLEFGNKISIPVFTGKYIKGEGFNPIIISLIDNFTGQVVKSGPEASALVEIVVLAGDFGGDNWTLEEFNEKIVREKEGKKSLLTGHVYVKLMEGIGSVGGIKFKHDANWMKNSEFRLGARVVDTFDNRVKEGKTESFLVRDFRFVYRSKHDIPSLTDDVRRLRNIGKRCAELLIGENISTVKDFLILHFTNSEKLRQILGTGTKMKGAVEHALRCIMDEAVYVYYCFICVPATRVVFNGVGKVLGLLLEWHYVRVDNLCESQKVVTREAVASAFGNWNDVICFDSETSLLQFCSSHLPNASNPSNSTNIEIRPSSHNFEASETIGEDDDYTQSNTFIQDNDSINDFLEDFCVDDFERMGEDTDVGFMFNQLGNVLGHQTSRLQDLDNIVQDSEEVFSGHQGFLIENSPHTQIAAAAAAGCVGEQAVSILAVRKRWKILFTVISILRYWFLNMQEPCRFSRNHVQKKPRHCC